MVLIGKLGSNHTTKIEIIASYSKEISIKYADQCLHIINNKERLNLLKGSTKMQKMEWLLKNIQVYKIPKGNLMLTT